jgi:hypothetical protein
MHRSSFIVFVKMGDRGKICRLALTQQAREKSKNSIPLAHFEKSAD